MTKHFKTNSTFWQFSSFKILLHGQKVLIVNEIFLEKWKHSKKEIWRKNSSQSLCRETTLKIELCAKKLKTSGVYGIPQFQCRNDIDCFFQHKIHRKVEEFRVWPCLNKFSLYFWKNMFEWKDLSKLRAAGQSRTSRIPTPATKSIKFLSSILLKRKSYGLRFRMRKLSQGLWRTEVEYRMNVATNSRSLAFSKCQNSTKSNKIDAFHNQWASTIIHLSMGILIKETGQAFLKKK